MTIDIFSTLTDGGRDALVQFFAGLLSEGKLLKFKMGEGGWTQSDLWTNEVATGDGGRTYSGDLCFLPVVPGTLSITDGVQTVTDDGAGNLTGNGVGTIDYKTGEWEVVFTGVIGSGTGIDATYRYRGIKSTLKTDEVGPGENSEGPYFHILRWRAPDAPIAHGTVTVSDGAIVPQTLTDTPNSPYDGEGTLSGAGTGTIEYDTGEISFLFTSQVPSSQTISVTYKYDGAPDAPNPALTDLISEGNPSLYTFEKDFEMGDIWEVESGRLRAKVRLELWEGLDDGSGGPPYFFEAGLFLEDGTMLCHATFTKSRKLGSTEIQFLFDQVL